MGIRIRLGILILSLLCFNTYHALASGQVLTWFDAQSKTRKRIDILEQTLQIEQAPGVWVMQSRIQVDPNLVNHLPPRIAPHHFLQANGRIRFSLAGTGQVLVFDGQTKRLQRIDQTFYAGYNFGATVFQRKNILYSFGGSGFWNFSKALTYYAEKENEWENIKANNVGPKAIFNGFQGYSDSSDLFYAGGSEYHDFLNNQATALEANIYSFDFNQHNWTLLGEINPRILQAKNREIVWTGRYFVQFSDQVLYVIDPVKNEVFEVERADANFQSAPDMFTDPSTIYAYWDAEGGKRKIYSIPELLKIAKPIGAFYEAPSQLYFYLLLAFLTLSVGMGYYVIVRSKKPNLDLDEAELNLVKALMDSSEGLSTVEVNEILGISTKNIDNQRKLRLQVISKINHKFQVKYNIGNVIIRNPSSVDKRQSLYSLKPEGQKLVSKDLNL